MTRHGALIGALCAAVVLALSLLDPELLGTECLASQIRESSSSPVIDTPIVNAFSAPVHAVTVADPVGGNRAMPVFPLKSPVSSCTRNERYASTAIPSPSTASGYPAPRGRIATLKPLVRDAHRGQLLADRWKEWTVNLSRART